MRFLGCLLALFLLFPGLAAAAPQTPGEVRVKLVTSAGEIVIAVDARRAPKTAANFLAYVDDGRLDGTNFYRAARRQSDPKLGFIQGGIATDYRRILPSVPLERTDVTGIKHVSGTVSLAHGANPDSGNGNFSIMVGDNPGLNATATSPGFAAFGRVLSGMDVVRKILALPSGGGRGPMRGQMIVNPVKLIRAQRLDGVAKPTGKVKPWLIGPPR